MQESQTNFDSNLKVSKFFLWFIFCKKKQATIDHNLAKKKEWKNPNSWLIFRNDVYIKVNGNFITYDSANGIALSLNDKIEFISDLIAEQIILIYNGNLIQNSTSTSAVSGIFNLAFTPATQTYFVNVFNSNESFVEISKITAYDSLRDVWDTLETASVVFKGETALYYIQDLSATYTQLALEYEAYGIRSSKRIK